MIEQHDQKVLLSIDWDFFVWGIAEALRARLPGASNEPPDDAARAWQALEAELRLGEEFSAADDAEIWRIRRQAFDRWGVRGEAEVNIRRDRGCVEPREFARALGDRFARASAPLWIADSHAQAYRAAQVAYLASARSLRVVHFDAHCDLGYSNSDVGGQAVENHLDCGSWLYHVLRTELAQNVDVVYPDWRGLGEWERYGSGPHLRPLLERIRVFTWSQWRELSEKRDAILCFVARSSPWTPPWTDAAFSEFVSSLGQPICLDCRDPRQSRGFDACKPRAEPGAER